MCTLPPTRETTKSPDNYQFNAGMAETIVATAGKFDAELEKAPGEVAARSGRVKDGFKESGPAGVAAMLGEQERLGVPEPRRVPLPESVATSLTERVASLPPEKQAEEVQAIAGEFGSMWPMVFRQIGGKLPSDAAMMATMPKGRPATLLAEASSLKDGELTAGLPSTAKREVEEALLQPGCRDLAVALAEFDADSPTASVLGRSESRARAAERIDYQAGRGCVYCPASEAEGERCGVLAAGLEGDAPHVVDRASRGAKRWLGEQHDPLMRRYEVGELPVEARAAIPHDDLTKG